jgi:hypothetical protein
MYPTETHRKAIKNCRQIPGVWVTLDKKYWNDLQIGLLKQDL